MEISTASYGTLCSLASAVIELFVTALFSIISLLAWKPQHWKAKQSDQQLAISAKTLRLGPRANGSRCQCWSTHFHYNQLLPGLIWSNDKGLIIQGEHKAKACAEVGPNGRAGRRCWPHTWSSQRGNVIAKLQNVWGALRVCLWLRCCSLVTDTDMGFGSLFVILHVNQPKAVFSLILQPDHCRNGIYLSLL